MGILPMVRAAQAFSLACYSLRHHDPLPLVGFRGMGILPMVRAAQAFSLARYSLQHHNPLPLVDFFVA